MPAPAEAEEVPVLAVSLEVPAQALETLGALSLEVQVLALVGLQPAMRAQMLQQAVRQLQQTAMGAQVKRAFN